MVRAKTQALISVKYWDEREAAAIQGANLMNSTLVPVCKEWAGGRARDESDLDVDSWRKLYGSALDLISRDMCLRKDVFLFKWQHDRHVTNRIVRIFERRGLRATASRAEGGAL